MPLQADEALAEQPEIAGAGAQEMKLRRELHPEWLIWRDEVIGAGVSYPPAVLDALAPRQREWERRPLAEDVIARERAAIDSR